MIISPRSGDGQSTIRQPVPVAAPKTGVPLLWEVVDIGQIATDADGQRGIFLFVGRQPKLGTSPIVPPLKCRYQALVAFHLPVITITVWHALLIIKYSMTCRMQSFGNHSPERAVRPCLSFRSAHMSLSSQIPDY